MKRFLALFASFGLIATTTPTVAACGKQKPKKPLPGQYDQLTNAYYDKNKNLKLLPNQLTYLTMLAVADYLREDSI
jgi:hypothetical protein